MLYLSIDPSPRASWSHQNINVCLYFLLFLGRLQWTGIFSAKSLVISLRGYLENILVLHLISRIYNRAYETYQHAKQTIHIHFQCCWLAILIQYSSYNFWKINQSFLLGVWSIYDYNPLLIVKFYKLNCDSWAYWMS